MANHLAGESSPYLLQHAGNPVDWYPWKPEALEKARTEDKPIFLSIGYSACHWCHVMERESFEDERTAAFLNDHFVSIKVDREERPDLDAVYMEAVQALAGQGGWPLSVWLTPEGAPFFGGTYFPPLPARECPRSGRSSRRSREPGTRGEQTFRVPQPLCANTLRAGPGSRRAAGRAIGHGYSLGRRKTFTGRWTVYTAAGAAPPSSRSPWYSSTYWPGRPSNLSLNLR